MKEALCCDVLSTKCLSNDCFLFQMTTFGRLCALSLERAQSLARTRKVAIAPRTRRFIRGNGWAKKGRHLVLRRSLFRVLARKGKEAESINPINTLFSNSIQ